MSFIRIVTVTSLLAWSAASAFAVEKVGSTVSAADTIRGQGAVGDRRIATADPIYRDEQLRSNETGMGQFQLGDGTKVVLGKNAQIVIDQYVIGSGGTAKTVTLKAVAGTFRFITGHSDHNAYRIETPQGTIGVRGTALEATVAQQLNLMDLSGRVWFCNRDAGPNATPENSPYCKWLDNPCDLLVADAHGPLEQPRTATDTYTPEELQNTFDIAQHEERLQQKFRTDSAACIGGQKAGGGPTGTGDLGTGGSGAVPSLH